MKHFHKDLAKRDNPKSKIYLVVGLLLVTGYWLLVTGLAVAQTASGPDLGTQYGELTGLKNIDPRIVAARLINTALGFLGIIAVGIILVGGFQWMTAMGNDEKVGKAKKLLIAGAIGLVIIIAAYVIAYFVIQQLVQATTLS